MKRWKILLVLFVAFALVGETAFARGRRSRGGGRSFRKWSGRSFRSGSKSSRTNIHLRHARKAGKQGVRYRSRSVVPQKVNRFSKQPKRQPSYIPHQINRNQKVYPVVFYHNSYGYWYASSSGRRFVPVESRQYVRTSSAGGVFLGLLILILFLAIVIFIIFSTIHASIERQKRHKQIIQTLDRSIPSNQNPLLENIYSAHPGKIVTFSDPITLSHYGKATDYMVLGSTTYKHSTFNLFKLSLKNYSDGDEIEMLIKEVDGDFCLFLGILDHEGYNQSLQKQSWFHLDKGEDSFCDQFEAVFPGEENSKEIRGSFVQFEFGAFYDVESSKKHDKCIGICEYYPRGFSDDFDWQHAIVLWEGDWLSCYYCREIHSRNIDVF